MEEDDSRRVQGVIDGTLPAMPSVLWLITRCVMPRCWSWPFRKLPCVELWWPSHLWPSQVSALQHWQETGCPRLVNLSWSYQCTGYCLEAICHWCANDHHCNADGINSSVTICAVFQTYQWPASTTPQSLHSHTCQAGGHLASTAAPPLSNAPGRTQDIPRGRSISGRVRVHGYSHGQSIAIVASWLDVSQAPGGTADNNASDRKDVTLRTAGAHLPLSSWTWAPTCSPWHS